MQGRPFFVARGLALSLAATASWSAVALADGAAAPPLMPTRDVTVVYSVQPQGAPEPQQVKVYFQGGGGSMRIDGPPGPPDGAPGGYMVVNQKARTMVVVLNQPRVFIDVPEGQQASSPFVLDPSMRFTADGSGTVTGLACTRYAIVATKGQAQACVTADGVVLSESGVDGEGNRGSLVAQTVTYAPLPASVFMPPPGFQRVAHPAGQGGPGAPMQDQAMPDPAFPNPAGTAPGGMIPAGPGQNGNP